MEQAASKQFRNEIFNRSKAYSRGIQYNKDTLPSISTHLNYLLVFVLAALHVKFLLLLIAAVVNCFELRAAILLRTTLLKLSKWKTRCYYEQNLKKKLFAMIEGSSARWIYEINFHDMYSEFACFHENICVYIFVFVFVFSFFWLNIKRLCLWN